MPKVTTMPLIPTPVTSRPLRSPTANPTTAGPTRSPSSEPEPYRIPHKEANYSEPDGTPHGEADNVRADAADGSSFRPAHDCRPHRIADCRADDISSNRGTSHYSVPNNRDAGHEHSGHF